MRWVAFGVLGLAVVVGGNASAWAVTRPVPVAKMPEIVRQGVLSAIAIVRDRGSTGLRSDLERCYRKIALTHDQTIAVYCMTQDRVETAIMTERFPGADDPFFNWNSFATRGVRATNAAVEPPGARSSFVQLLGAAQVDAMEMLSRQVSGSSN